MLASAIAGPAIAPAQGLVQLQMAPPKVVLGSMPLGAKAEGDILHLEIGLQFSDPKGMQQFVDSVSDPRSSQYRQFISPEQVGQRFGLPMTSVRKVQSYLTSHGMKIVHLPNHRLVLFADATVAQAEAAFHVRIENFTKLPLGAKDSYSYFSFVSAPSVPADIAPYIIQVGGMQNGNRPKPRDVSPPQLQTLYGASPLNNGGNTGQGRSIGISSFDGYTISSVIQEVTKYNLPVPAIGASKNVTAKASANSGGLSGDEDAGGEGDLDIQSVIGMAPLANVIVYDGGEFSGDLEGVLSMESELNEVDIITESYGWDWDVADALIMHNLHLAISAAGITYMGASGDYGTNLAPYLYPDTDPEVMMVGGTSAYTDTAGNRTSEKAWAIASEYPYAGSGGWFPTEDTFNVLPTYQSGLPKTINQVPISGVNYRLVPDISFNADEANGYDVYWVSPAYGEDGWTTFGGTSGASPTCAGGLADTEQALIAAGALPPDAKGHQRLGRIQDLLYSFNGDPSVFYDVTQGGSIGLLPNGYQALPGVGWDFTTGWGPLIFSGLEAKILGLATVTGITVSPTVVEGGNGVKITGTVTIASPATGSGATIALGSSDGSIVVPETVTVATGKTSATFTATSNSVSFPTTVLVSAAANGHATGTVTVNPPRAVGVTASPSSVIGGSKTVTGTVTIAEAAPAQGIVVFLGSNNASAAQVPDSVTVAPGAKTATFPITTNGVVGATSVEIGAVTGGEVVPTTLTVEPTTISAVTLTPVSVTGGTSISGTVTLVGPAPAGGASVALALSNSTIATAPSKVAVAAGATVGAFTISTKAVATTTSDTVTATLGVAKTAMFAVKQPAVSGITISASTALGGVVSPIVTVTLNGPAATGGAAVSLAATPSAAAKFADATLTVAAGKTSGTATLSTFGVAANTSVTVSAASGGVTKTVGLTVDAATLTSVTVSPSSVVGGSSTTVTGTVTLNGPAGPTARSVALSSSNTSAATVQASVSVAAGSKTGTFTVITKKVTATTSVTIKATLGTVSQSATLTVTK
jgi:subtilase family serine protease